MVREDKIVIIGLGKLGTNLLHVFVKNDFKVIQGFTRNAKKAESLTKRYEVDVCTKLDEVRKDGDLYFLTVPDDKIYSTGKKLDQIIRKGSILLHCSGASEDNILNFEDHVFGVFYPLQTFSKNKISEFSHIPIFYTASEKKAKNQIGIIAHNISSRAQEGDEKIRNAIHIAAVYACNFNNYLLKIAQDICIEKNIEFKALRHLVKETIDNAFELNPMLTQTGPAIRNDKETIKRHLDAIEKGSAAYHIYKLLSDSIKKDKDLEK